MIYNVVGKRWVPSCSRGPRGSPKQISIVSNLFTVERTCQVPASRRGPRGSKHSDLVFDLIRKESVKSLPEEVVLIAPQNQFINIVINIIWIGHVQLLPSAGDLVAPLFK